MKSKNLVILTVVAVVLVALAYLSSQKHKSMSEGAQALGKPVFETLQDVDKLNAIERIVFQSAGGTVEVARVGENWVAPGKHHYPVKFDKVHDFVRTVANLKVGQRVSGDRTQMEELGLAAPGEAVGEGRSPGTRIQMMGPAGVIESFVAGKEHSRAGDPDSPYGSMGGYADGRYLAVGGQAVLVWETLSGLPAGAKDWLDTDLVNLPSGDVLTVTVTGTNGQSLFLKRADGTAGELTLEKLSKKEVMNTSKANSLAGVLSYLTFEDVADPALTDAETGLDKPVRYAVTTATGKAYTLSIGGAVKGSDDRYGRLSAEFVPPAPVDDKAGKPGDKPAVKDEPKPAATNLVEKTDPEKEAARKAEEKKKKEEELKKLQDEVRELNAKVGKWVYVLKSHKVGDALMTRDQLVEDKDKKDAEKKEAEKKAAAEAKGDAKGEEGKAEAKDGEKPGFFGRLFGGSDKADEKK